MSQSVLLNGVVYTIPDTGEEDWGTNLTSYFVAIPQGVLQKTGGAFFLTADANFGASFGLVSAYFKSRTANIATAGILRLANTDSIGFRNNAGDGNLLIAIDGSNNLTFGGTKIIISGNIVNADISAAAAIARSKLASGTASYVLINDGTGVMSQEINLAKVRGGSGQDNSSLTFPSTGTLATLAGVESLSNKTFSDAITSTQISTPSSPASGKNKIYPKSDGNFYSLNSSGIEQQIGNGSGGLKNYLGTVNNVNGNGNFELGSTTGWSLGTTGTLTNGIPTGTPTFGSGASGNLSIPLVSSGQLAGSYSLSYVSSAATTAGNMLASQAFTLDIEDQAKVMTWRVYYSAITNPSNGNWSGTSSNSFGIAAYDVTNSVWLPLTGNFSMTQSSGVGYATGTFQTGATTASVRFLVYNANASAGAITLYFDDFFVGPQTAPYGPVVIDTQLYTVTITGSSSNPTKGTIVEDQGYWYRVGDTLYMRYEYQQSAAGSAGSGSYRFSLPSGFSIDTTKININPNSLTQSVGSGQAFDGTNGYGIEVTVATSTTLGLSIIGTTNNLGSGTVSLGGTVARIGFFATVPISGWSSNVQMSNDTDTRVVAARATNASASISGSASNITWTTVVSDTHSAFNGTSSVTTYTIPVTGFYNFIGQVFVNATSVSAGNNFQVLLRNSTNSTNLGECLYTYEGTTVSTGVTIPFSFTSFFLNAGTAIVVQINSNTNTPVLLSDSLLNYFAVQRLSGPAVIAATESVNARYNTAAGQSIANGSSPQVNFDTKVYDSHNAVTTGASWKFSAPISGKYSVKAGAIFTQDTFTYGAASAPIFLSLYKNGSQISIGAWQLIQVTQSQRPALSGSDTISLVAGDFIDIRISHNESGARTLLSSALGNFIAIERVGN